MSKAKRRLCFRLFDANQDGFAEKADFRCILETKIAVLRRPSWHTTTAVSTAPEAPDECAGPCFALDAKRIEEVHAVLRALRRGCGWPHLLRGPRKEAI